ncbi:retropepsin-like aspartic protease [uncultured Psychroserpens sp.]|uniref:retropepsin-like aspartic protease n=1 Tax=uncultured Psychroserpens sp. TaxID=255436 RepID=UPI002604A1ED|nr:retropepsin-like aspartic protease [uncultured Psychroserpens sp.]
MRKGIQVVLNIVIIACSLAVFAQNSSLKKGSVNGKNYYEEIEFEFEKNKIIIPVEIEDKTYRFLLDTGAPNIISYEVFKAIQPKVITTIPTNDANRKKQNLDVVSVESLKLGKTEFVNSTALVYDLNGSEIFKCFGIDGFIGSNLLRNSILQINAEEQLIKLTDKSKRLELDRKTSIKLKLVGNQSSPYVWIQIKGKEAGREMVLIDTGMGGLYDISRNHYNIFKSKEIFNEIGQSDGASSVSLFGEVPVNNQLRLHVPKLIINNFEINNCVTHTTKDDNSKIGAELLNYGVMTIDFRNKRFYFKPKTKSYDINTPHLGYTQTIKSNKIVIGYVWDEELQKLINYGDEILSVNGEEVTADKLCDYITKTSKTEALKQIELKVKSANGQIVDISASKKELTEILDNFNIKQN